MENIVINGDAFDNLPINCDCVITDPPYGIGDYSTVKTISSVGSHARVRENKLQVNSWDREVSFERLAELVGLSSPSCAIFCSDRQISELKSAVEKFYDSVAVLVWIKTNTRPSIAKSWFTNKTEYIVVGKKSGSYFADRGSKGNYNIVEHPFDTSTTDRHPCSKGVRVATDLIQRLCPANGLVVDPFCGGGSIIRAAKNIGMRYIGIDSDANFCEMAERNVARPFSL